MNDDEVMIEVHANRILVNALLVNSLLLFREIDLVALERIVHLLGDAEEVGPALQHALSHPDAQAVHQERQRGQKFGNATAIVGGIDVDDVQVAGALGLCLDARDRLLVNIRLVVLDLDKAMARQHLRSPHIRQWSPVASFQLRHAPPGRHLAAELGLVVRSETLERQR